MAENNRINRTGDYAFIDILPVTVTDISCVFMFVYRHVYLFLSDWSFTRNQRVYLLNKMAPDSLVQHMFQEKLITPPEYEEITACRTTRAKNTKILDYLPTKDTSKVDVFLECLNKIGFRLYHRVMKQANTLLGGLDEFQEHLGGKLTIPSITRIGETFDMFEIDTNQMLAAISYLKRFDEWGKNDDKTNSLRSDLSGGHRSLFSGASRQAD